MRFFIRVVGLNVEVIPPPSDVGDSTRFNTLLSFKNSEYLWDYSC